MVVTPSRARPVWLVTRPTRFPRRRANPSTLKTSMPVMTARAGSRDKAPVGPKSDLVNSAASH